MTWIVYDLLVDGVRVYVGHTNQPRQRMHVHNRTTAAHVVGTLVMKTISQHESKMLAEDAEVKRIKRLNPILNAMYCKRDVGSMTDDERRVLRKQVPAGWHKSTSR